jgi:L-cysteine S-thiosulfotransferase
MRFARAMLAACAAAIAVPCAAQIPAVADLFVRPEKGHCVACHQVPAGAGPQTLGDLGPPLQGARMRALGKAGIRAVIADPLRANPETVMPPFGRHRVLDAAEIERLVDYLHALPEAAPAVAAAPQEDAASAEAHAGEVAAVVEAGRKLWTAKFRNGRTLGSCFPNGGRRIAATYPLYDTRIKAIVTLEMAINQCRKTHNEPLFDATDPATMGAAVAYVRSLANGQKIAVRVPPAAQPKLEQGKRLYATRMGQRNYACASCHVQGAGKHFEDAVLSAAASQAPGWPVIRNASAITAQARMRECLERMGAAPFAAGSEELNQLEYYVTWLANGKPVKANAWRPK